ncbi:MAG TPA: hypothetical protein G4O08_05495 [Anaerolineae bacterium]|nr:hypothetical protein [Anaerolineae bacterium]
MQIRRSIVGAILQTFLLTTILTGCIGAYNPGLISHGNPGIVPSVETVVADPTETTQLVVPMGTAAPTETSTPEPSPTADTRPLPEDWFQWPIIPTLSPSMVEVYLQGVEMGNDPHHFSKAGDCQNVPGMFMGLFDIPDFYTLSASQAHLQETIDFYAGSFGRDSIAVKGGFTFPALFSPLRADPTQCGPGETPLECELRIWDPTFLIVSMELPFSGRTSETYEEYLTQVVEYALDHGIVPILTTKADNIEQDYSINQSIARVAYAYDVPMINFWLAVQGLPNRGIDIEDTLFPGFHTSGAARRVRSYDVLQTLDDFLRIVRPLLPPE